MVNGHPLPYDSFSTGESMSATILLRLLVAEMATTADFCWFDEPLSISTQTSVGRWQAFCPASPTGKVR